MASRAHVIPHYDYDLGRGSERGRRQVRYQSDDPIEIPRGRSRDGGGLAVAISALIASSIILGGAYAIYVGPPPAMAATPTLPLYPTWQQDSQPQQAMVQRALQGPALVTAGAAAPATLEEQATAASEPTLASPPEPARAPASSSPEVIIDDRYQLPQPAPQAPTTEPAPYPDPSKTPPDGIGPTLDMSAPTPGVDPENPYRE